MRKSRVAVALVALLTLPTTASGSAPGALPDGDVVTATLVGAGDIAGPWLGDDQTAALLDDIPGTVFTAGDNAYLQGTLAEYLAWYELTWGRHKARTRPAPGNHDYETGGGGDGSGYRAYFGANAGPDSGGWYSYDIGAWHVIVLNGECSKVGGCGPGSPQAQWLREDLAAHPTHCTAAIFHYPRFNSGGKGEAQGIARGQTFWTILHEHHVEIVISGDEHVYERFAPQTPDGELDPDRGIRQFTVGTGGALAGSFSGTPKPNSEARIGGVPGVLRLDLGEHSYAWQFVPVEGQTATDVGSGSCHSPTPEE